MAVSLAPRRSPECPGYQVMRTDQRRYFGHPDLVQFIQRLSNQVHNKGMGTVLIGDMGMPAGGRFNGGHASHQTGLDVDIFLQLPQTRWTSSQLLKPQALDWSPAMASMWCRRYGARKSASLSSWRRKIAKLPASSSTRRLNSSCARTRAATASGCVKSVPGSSIALICTSDCVARREVWSARIRRRRRPAMAAERSCRAGSNHLNPGLPPVKKTPPPLPPSCRALLDEHVL